MPDQVPWATAHKATDLGIVDNTPNNNDAGATGYELVTIEGAQGGNQGPIMLWERPTVRGNTDFPPASNYYSDVGPGWMECRVHAADAVDHVSGWGLSVYGDNWLAINMNADACIAFGQGGNPETFLRRSQVKVISFSDAANTERALIDCAKGSIHLGNQGGSDPNLSPGLCAGVGVPAAANGANGDFYFRGDGGAGTSIYQKRAGVWVGIV